MLKAVSDSIYMFEDTCKVYVVKNGKEAVLIDFGDGGVLDALQVIGVEHVAAIYMTHHHRDQGQGLPKAVDAGIPIYVPHAEQDLFSRVDAHWQAREIRNNYNVRQDRFSLLESVPIAGTLKDYSMVTAGGITLQVIPTPGHTTGSVSLLADIDGKRVAFTGDLIYGPGQVWSMSATQWTYNGAEGVAASIASLLDLKDRKPELLLPSHGEPMDLPEEAIDMLVERFWALLQARKQNPRLFLLRDTPYDHVLPHLLKSRATMSNYFVLLSDSGKALLLDFGYDFVTGIAAGADRASRRPWLYSIPKLKQDFGVASIDAVLLTHYHDDHVAGCNLLREVEGAQVWAAETFAGVLEHPSDYDLPCLWYDPVPVDRVLPLEQTIRWEEYAFTLHALPGHTLYAVGIAFEADGKKVLVAGDQYQGDEGVLYNYVYQNRYQLGDYRRSAELYRRLQPDVILTGHWEPLWVKPGYFDELDERGELLEGLHEELLPLEQVSFGAEGVGARFKPYELHMDAGSRTTVQVEIINPLPTEELVQVRLDAQAQSGLAIDPPVVEIRVKPNGTAAVDFELAAREGMQARRLRIAVDLTVGSKRFGQQAEALVHVSVR